MPLFPPLLTLFLTIGNGIPVPVTATPVASPQASPFVEAMAYYLEDSGRWRAPNPAYRPGFGRPEEFGYQFRWDLDRRIATLYIQGIYDDGNVVDFWLYTSSYHPMERRVRLDGFSNDGRVARGHRDVCEDPEPCTFLEVTDRFRTESTRETIEILGPDVFRSTTARLVDGVWVPQTPLVWRRVRDAHPLSATPR